jgi:hypothetical protein
VVRAAALLHDVGHYPFSHALEEIGALHHEEVARPLLFEGELAAALRAHLGDDAPARVYALIRGESASPYQGLISGSLDLDKIEYLKRDALMCGVPYGEIDVDRLTNSLRVLRDPLSGRAAMGVTDKGLAALESLLFAKYQMYRNVYWHHGVRAATAMYKRLVDDALSAHTLAAPALAGYTDEGLLGELERRSPSPLLAALRERRLHKRAVECPAGEFGEDEGEWIAQDRALTVGVENALARELGRAPGEVLLDYPAKAQMLGLDILVERRGGRWSGSPRAGAGRSTCRCSRSSSIGPRAGSGCSRRGTCGCPVRRCWSSCADRPTCCAGRWPRASRCWARERPGYPGSGASRCRPYASASLRPIPR